MLSRRDVVYFQPGMRGQDQAFHKSDTILFADYQPDVVIVEIHESVLLGSNHQGSNRDILCPRKMVSAIAYTPNYLYPMAESAHA